MLPGRPTSVMKLRNAHVPDSQQLSTVLEDAKRVATQYYRLTGRPLGITGEIAEYEAIRLLGLTAAEVRQPGYDATRSRDGKLERIQIKGRVLLPSAKPGQRIGSINLNKEWDCVMLVILDEQYEAVAIYEADRQAIAAALRAPGSKARNERGALGVSKFRAIGTLVWPQEP